MAEHGFLKPNPALLDLELRKPKRHLAHELGEGAKCLTCGDGCPGFQLHYWRKVCQNCRCGKAEHNVVDEQDPGFYFVGKIFDRPLRSKAEELEFCYGDDLDDSHSSSDDGEAAERVRKRSSLKAPHGSSLVKKKVRFEWVPPNTSRTLTRKYLKELPEDSLPIAGSEGAQMRRVQLAKQFPKHDIEPSECHDLTPGEVESMEHYIANVKENVVGQGVVTEVSPGPEQQHFPPPPSDEFLDQLGRGLERKVVIGQDDMPPPPLPAKPKTSVAHGDGTFYAKPLQPPPVGPKPLGSTSSSINSSRNNTPSPTSSNDDHRSQTPQREHEGAIIPNLVGGQPGAYYDHHHDHNQHGKKRADKNRCVECKGMLQPGDVAVRADRAGPSKLWHPQCFKCSECQEILVDLLYYFHGNRVFCARDYAAQAKIPRCAACDELIFAVEYTGAENRAWHIKHFCCYECDRPLAGHKYIPINSQPHCLLCYQAKHGKTCRSCGEYIHPEDQRVSLKEDHWHAKDECFCCAMCHVSLLGRKMTRKYDLLLCSSVCSKKAGLMKDAGPIINSQSTLV